MSFIQTYRDLYDKFREFNYIGSLWFAYSVFFFSYKRILLMVLGLLVVYVISIYVSFFAPLIFISVIFVEGFCHLKSEKYYHLKNQIPEDDKIKNKEGFLFEIETLIKLSIIYLIKFFASFFGLLLFVLPGGYIYIKMSMARHFFITEGCGIREAISKSWNMTSEIKFEVSYIYGMTFFIIISILVLSLFLSLLLIRYLGNYESIVLILSTFFPFILFNHVLLQSMKTELFLETYYSKESE